ncbi:MAG: class I SAM-dependent methyltransferase [Thermodesulfobacteriota bacterium]
MPTPLKYPNQDLAVSWQEEPDREQALALAKRLQLPLASEKPECVFLLHFRAGRLELQETGPGKPGPVFVDFCAGKSAYRRLHGGGRDQPLARAVGLKKNRCPLVLDATAGLGRDAFVLASLGCTVRLVERSPILHALLEDGLKRGKEDEDIKDIIARMTLSCGDSQQRTSNGEFLDVIFLDPMYPHRQKASLVKKEMRLTRALVGDDDDADALLAWAISCCPGRVVVKRPKGAPFLGNKKPPLYIKSKNSRFDVYFPHC